MSTVYVSWNLTVLQAIKDGITDILTHSALEGLVEERGHAIGAWGYDRLHLLRGYFYFLPVELLEQL